MSEPKPCRLLLENTKLFPLPLPNHQWSTTQISPSGKDVSTYCDQAYQYMNTVSQLSFF